MPDLMTDDMVSSRGMKNILSELRHFSSLSELDDMRETLRVVDRIQAETPFRLRFVEGDPEWVLSE